MSAITTNRFANVVAGLLVVAVLAFGGLLAYTNLDLQHQLAASQTNAKKLYDQLLDEGIQPTAQEPAQAIKGAAGDTGATGDTGPRGYPGPEGIQGPPGVAGQTGTAGTNGADSSTPGPQGPAGANGANGLNGADGAAGQPPFSWTQPGILGPETCTRTDPFDPASPTYQCTTDQGATP